jgi:hypothetical protein
MTALLFEFWLILFTRVRRYLCRLVISAGSDELRPWLNTPSCSPGDGGSSHCGVRRKRGKVFSCLCRLLIAISLALVLARLVPLVFLLDIALSLAVDVLRTLSGFLVGFQIAVLLITFILIVHKWRYSFLVT